MISGCAVQCCQYRCQAPITPPGPLWSSSCALSPQGLDSPPLPPPSTTSTLLPGPELLEGGPAPAQSWPPPLVALGLHTQLPGVPSPVLHSALAWGPPWWEMQSTQVWGTRCPACGPGQQRGALGRPSIS